MVIIKHKVYISKVMNFESAHFLPNHRGQCQNLHGHSYKLIVTVEGFYDKDTGMVLDFTILKKILNEYIVEIYDHTLLNNFFENPTAEIMAVKIFETLSKIIPKNTKLSSVKLYETDSSFVEYKGETSDED